MVRSKRSTGARREVPDEHCQKRGDGPGEQEKLRQCVAKVVKSNTATGLEKPSFKKIV